MRPAPGFLIGGAVLVAASTALVAQVATSFQTPPPRPVASAASAADAAKIAVAANISGFAFPLAIRVATGGNVTWRNADPASHTVTFDDTAIASSDISGGASTKVAFARKGTFTYHCTIHTSMTGSVEVVDASTAPTDPDPYDPYDPYGQDK